MIVVMNANCSDEQVQAVQDHIAQRGFSSQVSRGVERTVVGVVGQPYPALQDELEVLPGVGEVIRVSAPYKLASREFHPENTLVRVGNVEIGRASCRERV